jgi:hypothetical protein
MYQNSLESLQVVGLLQLVQPLMSFRRKLPTQHTNALACGENGTNVCFLDRATVSHSGVRYYRTDTQRWGCGHVLPIRI